VNYEWQDTTNNYLFGSLLQHTGPTLGPRQDKQPENAKKNNTNKETCKTIPFCAVHSVGTM